MSSTDAKPDRTKSRQGDAGKARVKLADLPDLIPHFLVADKLGITTDRLRDWVAQGTFPEPHSMVERTWFYRVDLVRVYLEIGRWPEGTKFRWGGGGERE